MPCLLLLAQWRLRGTGTKVQHRSQPGHGTGFYYFAIPKWALFSACFHGTKCSFPQPQEETGNFQFLEYRPKFLLMPGRTGRLSFNSSLEPTTEVLIFPSQGEALPWMVYSVHTHFLLRNCLFFHSTEMMMTMIWWWWWCSWWWLLNNILNNILVLTIM